MKRKRWYQVVRYAFAEEREFRKNESSPFRWKLKRSINQGSLIGHDRHSDCRFDRDASDIMTTTSCCGSVPGPGRILLGMWFLCHILCTLLYFWHYQPSTHRMTYINGTKVLHTNYSTRHNWEDSSGTIVTFTLTKTTLYRSKKIYWVCWGGVDAFILHVQCTVATIHHPTRECQYICYYIPCACTTMCTRTGTVLRLS